MIEVLICCAVLLFIFASSQIGAKSGSFPALSWMLAGTLSLFVTMRYWFLLSRWAMQYEVNSLPVIAALCLWVPFLLLLFVITRLCSTYLEQFESVESSFGNRVLGTIFGAITGTVFAAMLIMTASLLVPDYFLTGKPSNLPVPVHEMPSMAYRFIERNVAGVNECDAAHTLLPRLKEGDPKPCVFWQ